MKLRYILPAIILIAASSCSPDPHYELLEYYSFSFKDNSANRMLAGENKDVLLSYTLNKSTHAFVDSFRVEFEVVSGGGTVDPAIAYVNPDMYLPAGWKLGNEAFRQELRASIYYLTGKYLTCTSNFVYAFRENEWNKITDEFDGRMRDLVADTVNGVSMMVSHNELYRQGERYFLWEKVFDHSWDGNPRTIEIDSEGVIYISTWNGLIYRSADQGESWHACSKPYPGRDELIYTYVSNDDDLWVYAQGERIKRSKDGGDTWTEIYSLESAGFGDVFRLNNGNLLFHGSNCCSLYLSDDDGTSWTFIPTPGSSIKLYVNENDEIVICTQLSGLAFYSSTDYGATFTLVHQVYPEFGMVMGNTFNRWEEYYYVAVPGYGILKTHDLVNYEAYWRNPDIIELFIDHNGVLVARDINNISIYYRHNTE
ncbi:MAG: sialidase family protein [Bacteroidales bacterium]|nr:sialidase family protein [Bacteroidales bacterium]